MSLRSRRFLLFLAGWLTYCTINAQTLYWVGGHGNFNDPAHWSLNPGGSSANIIPGSNSNVVFSHTGLNTELKVIFDAKAEVNSLLIETYDKIKFIHKVNGTRLVIKSSFQDLLDNKSFNSEVTFEFANDFQNQQGYISSGNLGLTADFIISAGKWKVNKIKLDFANSLYVHHSDVEFKYAYMELGDLDMENCSSLRYDHVVLKTARETRIKKCNNTYFIKSYLNGKLFDSGTQNTPSIYSIVGRSGSNQINSLCVPTPTVIRPTCAPGCDGQVIVSLPAASCFSPAATLPYQISVNTNGCSGSPSQLASIGPGTHTLTGFCACGSDFILMIQDANGVLDDPPGTPLFINVPVTQPGISTSPSSAGTTSLLCNGVCNGTASVSFFGGTAPYNFTITPPTGPVSTNTTGGTLTFTNLCAGTLTVFARDQSQCTKTYIRNFVQPAALNTNSVLSNILCNGPCTGSLAISPTGGNFAVGPLTNYTVNFSPGGTFTVGPGGTVTNAGLCVGAVSATLTDNKNCSITTSSTIVQPPAITVTANQTSVTCSGVCDASATITLAGGVGPYQVTVTPTVGSPTTMASAGVVNLSSLCGGNHSVTVRDFNNCTSVQTFSIDQPPAVTITPTFTNVTCNGGNNGVVVITPSGGNGGPYSYTWSPAPPTGQGTATISNLTANSYSVIIAYGGSCNTTTVVPITQPPALTLTVLSQSISCFGVCNGSSSVTASGGNGSYSFNWSPVPPSGQGTGTISSLCGGTSFTVTVSDASLCVYPTASVSVTQASSITPNIVASNLSCASLCNGSITASPTGTATFNYTLATSGSTITTAPPYTGLCANTYTVFIRNLSTSCTQSSVTVITAPLPLTGALSSTSLTCNNVCNGSLSGSAAGGTAGYTLSIATPTSVVAGGTLNGQCVGTYTLLITDANGCTNNTVTATITQPPAITISIASTSVSCASGNNGALNANVTGGTPGYTLSWSNGFTSNPNINLPAGNYTLTVTDLNGCSKVGTSTVTAPAAIALTQATTGVACSGGSTGSATITATGGTAPYTFQFNNLPPTTNTTGLVSGLPQGNYIANVTDASGCAQPISFTISAPPLLTAVITNTQNSCNVCIGAATVQPSGGTAPYVFAWTNSLSASVGSTSVATNLCAGDYTVLITDNQLCTVTKTVNIAQVIVVNLAMTGTSVQCFGACNGSAAVVPSGGIAPYLFSWSPGAQTAATATNLCANFYSVTVTDFAGCTNTGTVNITQPASLTATSSQTNAVCSTSCNGAISTTISGGIGAISYTWNPGGINSSSLTNVCAGSYSLSLRDANSCTLTVPTITITSPPPVALTRTVTNPSACIANNGSICATVSGGTGAGYTFTWSPVAGAASCLTGLSAGSYTLIAGDGAGCTNSITGLVSNPVGPSLTTSTLPVNCFGGTTGAATVTATGLGPFQFTWTPASTTVTNATNIFASGLSTGTYVVMAMDQSSCVTSQNVVITQASSVTANGTVTAVRCNAAANGSIVVAPTGGNTPYNSFNWLPIGLTGAGTRTVTGLGPLIYTLTINDFFNCTSTFTFNVTQPTALTLTNSPTQVKCNAACNGSIVAGASGGTGVITYNWLPVGAFTGSTTASVLNLCPNSYTVIATDINGCTISNNIPISQPSALTNTIILKNATCSNSCNAIATNTVSGGIPPYSYSWSSSAATTTALGSLCGGNYTGTATDANGCIVAKGFTVVPPPQFSVNLTPTNPKCNAICNGSITTSLSGAHGAVIFNWSPAGAGQNPTGLCIGNYSLVATDDSLCVANGSTTLINPPTLLANVSTTNALCAGACNGKVSVTPVNAVGAVNFVYIPAKPNSGNLTGVCAGNFSVQITDANGCSANNTFTLNDPPALVVNPSTNPSTCGFSNGTITANVVGGTPSYTYAWLAPAVGSTSVLTNLAAGVYTLVVTDANNCTNTVSIPLSNSNGPTAAPIISSNLNCNNQCIGTASVNVGAIVGGTPGYTVAWLAPAPSTLNPLSNLCAGTYTAKITDANNCILFSPVTIFQPPAVVLAPSIGLPSCNSTCDGSLALNPSGGVGPSYSFTWFPGGFNGSSITNACAANYTIFVRDNGNTCVYTQSVNLPAQLNIVLSTSTTPNVCFGDCNGTATAFNVSGGVPPYTYKWSNGQSGTTATNLCNGPYTLIVTDANGCFNSFNVNINSASPITATASVTPPLCNLCNGSSNISASGGSGTFLFTWSTGSTLTAVTGLCAGIYQVQITDVLLGCRVTETVIVNSSNGITGENFAQNLPCGGNCNGTATVTAVGGTGPIVYNWVNPAVSNSVVTNLCSGTYFVQMTDALGCLRTSSVLIAPSTPINLTAFVNSPSCSLSNGTISVIISGGTPGYAISWNPPIGLTSTVTGIGMGSYTISVTESGPNACTVSKQITVSNSSGPLLTAAQTNVNCFGTCTGAITTTVSGAGPFTYNWSVGGSGTSVSNLCKGIVTLTVTDFANCATIRSFTITENPQIQSGLPQITQPSCNLCNGLAITDIFGGTLPYTYTWTTGALTPSLSGLCAGFYQVGVTDALGCTQTTTVIINNSNGISGENFNVQGLPCAGTCNGSATVTAVGGNPPYVYNWINPAVTNSVISNLCAGSYFVQITDAQGCMRTSSVGINPITTLSVTPSIVQPGCQQTNGSIVIAIVGGTPAYVISWAPIANNTRTLSGIGQGSYTLTVTESGPNNCSFVQQINLSNTTGPVVSASQTNIACFNACTGVVTASATGVAPITYNWSVGGNSTTASNLCKGVITLTVTDGNNCVSIRSFTITENPQIQIGVPQITEPSCNLCNGSAIVSAFGGILPYTYTWTTGVSGPSVTSLCAGLYQVDIKDALGCLQTHNLIINNSTGITGETFTVQGLPCAGTCVGSLTVAAVGGTAPVSYNWINPPVAGPVISNLCSGSYFVQMVDAVGCTRVASVSIAPTVNLSISPSVVQPGCQLTNGSVIISISGGTPAYNISWSPIANNTRTLSGIGQGSYFVTVVESGPNSCSVTSQINVNNVTGPGVTATQTNVACYNVCTGVITATATGIAPFTYKWSVGGNSPTVTNLCKGVVTLTVADGNNCVTIRSFTITENPQILLGVSQLNQPICNMCNGSATVNAVGGSLPYTYTWSTGATGTSASNLCAGLYQIDVSDALGCSQTQNVIINNSNGITAQNFSVQGLPCNGACVGSATVVAVGGTQPIVYTWVNPALTNSVITNLCAGNYFVQMTDAVGCIRTASTDIKAITTLSLSTSIVQPGCQQTNGSVIVNVTGGTPAYNYSWAPLTNTTPTLTGIGQGSYTITVTESGPNNCSLSQQIILSNSTGPAITFTQSVIDCFGTCSGSIAVTATGSGPFTYNWSVGGNSSIAKDLCKGVVTLTVTDINNCVSIRSFTLVDNPQLQMGVPSFTQPSCNLCNGVAIINITGGTLPYTYTWTNGVNTASASGLCAGLYQVDVADARGCPQTVNVLINNSSGITGQNFNVQGLPCNATCNGSASVTAIGGTQPITYNWVNPAVTSSVISGLCAGDYFVQMTDGQGCIRTASVTIAAVTTLSISSSLVLPGCQLTNGSIKILVSGGTPSYNISWAPIANNTATLSGVGQGSYTVTVLESGPNTCSLSQQVTLSNVTGPVVTATQFDINCFGTCTGSITASATGSGPFNFNWSVGGNASTITNLCSGVITLSVTDVNNCVTIKTFTITENPPLLVSAPQITQPACNVCNGVATINAFGGSLPYTYLWTTGVSGQVATNLCGGLYQALITDALGCQITQNILINNVSGIVSQSFSVQDENCINSCNGSATVTAIGGAAPIAYSWINPAAPGNVLTNLCGGDYFVQMTDANGCIRTASVMINSATNMSLSPLVTQPSCGASNGVISMNVTGGTLPYVYTWLPSGSTSSLSNLNAGSYTVSVTDKNGAGCTQSLVINLNSFNAPSITFTQSNINCFNACTGSIVALASGTASPFTYNWSNGGNAATVTNLCKGIVNLTVTATNGCISVRSFTLSDSPELELSAPNMVRPGCFGGCDGSVTIIPSGGSLPFTFNWLPSGSGNPLGSLCAGTYTTIITDAKGCVDSSLVTLKNPAPISVTSTPVNSSCSSVADGSIGISIAGGTPAYTFTWTGPAAFSSTLQNISNILSGNYSLSLNDNAGCKRDTMLTLVPTITITARAGRDSVICGTGSIILTGTNSAGAVTFDWFQLPGTSTVANTASFAPPISSGSSTFVLLTVSSVTTCFSRDTVVIGTFPEILVDAGANALIPIFSSVTIGGSPTSQGAISLTWTPAFSLSDAFSQNPLASNTVNTVYTVTASDANGCTASDTVRVDLYPEVKISNGFSPNGDGKNDLWIIDYIDQFPDNTVEIYNRWGEQLFYSKGYVTPFNGQYHGKDLPVGTYYFIINLNHPAYTKPYTGPLTIFR